MGWTHHWQRPQSFDADKFAAAATDCRRLVTVLPLSLAGPDGSGLPIFNNDQIALNGVEGENCEPFVVNRTEYDRRGRDHFWSFCKTEHLPYDQVVQAALIILKFHLGDALSVGSDGKAEHWEAAKSLVVEHLGYGKDFMLDS